MSTILIIEDNQDIRENIAELLELSGYTVLEAENGRIGAKKALAELPNLILCDIMMPELDGYGVLHILSKHDETLNIPFIFLTAKADKLDVRKGMTLGADDYITKPYDESDLLSAIENRLKKSGNRDAAAVKSHTSMEELLDKKIVRSYQAKDIIFKEGDTPAYLYYLNSGKIKIQKMNKDGKEVIFELIKPGEFFGYWSVLEEKNQSDTAESIEISEVWMIPIVEFRRAMQDNVAVSNKFFKLLSNNMLIKEHKILEMAYDSVRRRMANALLELCDKYGEQNHLEMRVPRELIASMAGTSVETAIRMLSEFKNDKLIEISANQVNILDYERLKNAPF